MSLVYIRRVDGEELELPEDFDPMELFPEEAIVSENKLQSIDSLLPGGNLGEDEISLSVEIGIGKMFVLIANGEIQCNFEFFDQDDVRLEEWDLNDRKEDLNYSKSVMQYDYIEYMVNILEEVCDVDIEWQRS